jgi:hypothetical protein
MKTTQIIVDFNFLSDFYTRIMKDNHFQSSLFGVIK